METHVNKIVISFIFLLINLNIIGQNKISNITLWQSNDINSILVEEKDIFKLFCCDYDPLIFDKTEKKYMQVKHKDVFSFKMYFDVNEEIIGENNLKIEYKKRCSNKLSIFNKYLKNDITFNKIKKTVEYDSIVFYEFISNYILSDQLIVDQDTFEAGYYDKLLFNKAGFRKNRNFNIDIYVNQILNKINKIPPYPHEFDDGAFVIIIIYLKNGSSEEVKVKALPKYIDEYVLPKDKRDKLKSLFKGVL